MTCRQRESDKLQGNPLVISLARVVSSCGYAFFKCPFCFFWCEAFGAMRFHLGLSHLSLDVCHLPSGGSITPFLNVLRGQCKDNMITIKLKILGLDSKFVCCFCGKELPTLKKMTDHMFENHVALCPIYETSPLYSI
jgi:hypothetical protein